MNELIEISVIVNSDFSTASPSGQTNIKDDLMYFENIYLSLVEEYHIMHKGFRL
jgi:hypothetical protein